MRHEIKASKIILYNTINITIPGQKSGIMAIPFSRECTKTPFFTYTIQNNDDLDGIFYKLKTLDNKHAEILITNTKDVPRDILIYYKAEDL